MVKIDRLVNNPIISDKLLSYFKVFDKMEVDEVYRSYSEVPLSEDNVVKLINCFNTILKAKFAVPKGRKVPYKISQVLVTSTTNDMEEALLCQVYKLLEKLNRGDRSELNFKVTTYSINRNFKLERIEENLKSLHPEELLLFYEYQKSLNIDKLWELSSKIYEKFYS